MTLIRFGHDKGGKTGAIHDHQFIGAVPFMVCDCRLRRLGPASPSSHHTSPGSGEARHKSPVLAWFLSWLVPGGGQGYNGQWGKAAGFFIAAAAGFALVLSTDGFSCSGSCGTRDAGLVVLAISSIGSQIEAPIAASNINRQSRKTSPPQVGVIIGRIGF